MKIPLKIKIRLILRRIKLTWRYKFAHHPLCSRFEDHVFKIGNVYLCQGCTLTYLGLVFGAITSSFYLNRYISSIYELLYAVLTILSPIILVEISGTDYRPLKRIIRFTGGFGIGIVIVFISTNGETITRLWALSMLIISYIIFRIIRIKKKSIDLCEGCPELDANKVCSGYKLQTQAEKEYQKYADQLLQPIIQKEYALKYNIMQIKPKKDNPNWKKS